MKPSRKINREFERAARLYRDFSGHDAEPFAEVTAPVAPSVGIVIGYCDGLLYSAVRDERLERYIHEFANRDRPLFVVSPNGRQLMLYGGNFRFTERGIVDRSDKSR